MKRWWTKLFLKPYYLVRKRRWVPFTRHPVLAPLSRATRESNNTKSRFHRRWLTTTCSLASLWEIYIVSGNQVPRTTRTCTNLDLCSWISVFMHSFFSLFPFYQWPIQSFSSCWASRGRKTRFAKCVPAWPNFRSISQCTYTFDS